MREIIGIVSGMGSYAGLNIFNNLLRFSGKKKDQDFIEIILYNNPKIPDRTEHIINNGDSPLEELCRSVKVLDSCGVSKILIGCVTAHFYLNVLKEYTTRAKIIDIISETVAYLETEYFESKRIGILGTRGLARAGIWQKAFKDTDKSLLFLSDEDQEELFDQAIYGINGIKSGCFDKCNTEKIETAIFKLFNAGADIVLGSCSELGLVISTDLSKNYIDVMELAIRNIIACYYNEV